MADTAKDVGRLVGALLTADPDNAPRSPRAVARSVHGTAGTFVRWIIVFVALTPFVFAGFALPSPEFARAVVPGVTLVALIVTVLLLAFKWDKLVTGLVELGIITTLVSKVKKPQALGSLAGAVKDLGTATLRWTSKVIGLELLAGIYFSFVPVANERVLILGVLMLMATTVFLTLGKVKRLAWIPITLLFMATFVFFSGGIDEAVAKYEGAASAASAQAPAQTEGLLIIRKGTEEILHIPDDQEVLELPLVVGQDTVRMALPANATDAEIETRPTDKPYMMCFEGKGCFVSNPGEHWDADFDFDTTIFWFQGVEPGVTMVITPIGR